MSNLPRPSFKKCGSRNDNSWCENGYSSGYSNSLHTSCGRGFLKGAGTNLLVGARCVPPAVFTEAVNTHKNCMQRATCQPPKCPAAAARHTCAANAPRALAISRASSTMREAGTPHSAAAHSGENFDRCAIICASKAS